MADLIIRRTTFGVQHRCPDCGCSVRPDHVPGSDACHDFSDDRTTSLKDD